MEMDILYYENLTHASQLFVSTLYIEDLTAERPRPPRHISNSG